MLIKRVYESKYNLAVLAGFVIAVYYPIIGNDFLYNWDDQWQVMNFHTEGGLNFHNLWKILMSFYHGQYSPVNQYMYLFIYSLFGYSPFAFHLASLLLHLGIVCLVYIVIKRLFAQTTRAKIDNAEKIAFVTALLFAVHPMNVESVAWISASKIMVYAFFYFSATYCFLVYLEKKKFSLYILSLLLFALSFGGKEQAITFPIWLILLYWLLGWSLKERKVWVKLSPFLILLIAFTIVTLLSHDSSGGRIFSTNFSNTTQYPLWQRFVLGSYSFVEYMVKFIFPHNLLYLYPFPMLIGEPSPAWMLLYPTLIFIITASTWQYLRKWPLSTGLLFFLIHIVLVLHIIPLSRFVVIADRYIYLSGIGLSFIIAYYFVKYIEKQRGLKRKITIGFFALIVLVFGIYSNRRSRDWKDTESIKMEIREMIKHRDDYKPEEFDKLLEDNRNGS